MALSAEQVLQMISIIESDMPDLDRLKNYSVGIQDDPYVPDEATDELKTIAARSKRNFLDLTVDTTAQALVMDDYRVRFTGEDGEVDVSSEAFRHVEDGRLHGRQHTLYRAIGVYGQAFLLADKDRETGKVFPRILSTRSTTCLYEDPVNDIEPIASLTVQKWDKPADGDQGAEPLIARGWDEDTEYKVEVTRGDKTEVKITNVRPHGADRNPVTRFTFYVDDDGVAMGLVEPLMPLQDSINQVNFDLLTAASSGAHAAKWISGMQPPIMQDEFGDPILDDNGNAIPLPVKVSGKTLLMAEDTETKFGTFDVTPLGGYVEVLRSFLQDWIAKSQIPAHHMLGQMPNVAAEALDAADAAHDRKMGELRNVLSEMWERHFRVVAAIEGTAGADDTSGEVVWRDIQARSLSKIADALGKMVDSLGVPRKGAWHELPGMTPAKFKQWEEYLDEEQPEDQMYESVSRSLGTRASRVVGGAVEDEGIGASG